MKTTALIVFCLLCLAVCANSENLVVGSGFAAEKEFPHVALIGFENSKDDFEYVCAGFLISKRFVLTVANCAFSQELRKAKFVKLGDVKRNESNANTYTYEIIERIKHQNFTSRAIDHNVALFKLDKDVEFNDYVKPACLPVNNKEPELAVGTGWGITEFGGELSTKLKKITMEIFTQDECQKSYSSTGKTRNGIDYESNICAGSHTLEGIDMCAGDSGAPLQIPATGDTCSWTVIGITSYGTPNCGQVGFPGVYLRVWAYLEWIQGIIGAE